AGLTLVGSEAEPVSRLGEAYVEAVDLVLAEQDDPAYRGTGRKHRWLAPGSLLLTAIAKGPDPWIRAAYLTLVPGVRAAYDEQAWDMCQRVASRLGGSVPPGLDLATAESIMDLAERATTRLGPLAKAEVLRAKGSILLGFDRYTAATDVLHQAAG